MTLTTEVFLFEANDDFRKDPNLVIPAFDVALKADGVHGPVYYGKQVEEPSTWGFVFLNWDSYESHKALIDGPSYAAVAAGFKPGLGPNGKLEMHHVQFSAEVVALKQPVTAVTIMSLKTPENREALIEVLSKMSEATGKLLVFGQTREDENKYIVISGWPSVEAHREKAEQPETAAVLDKLNSLANRDYLYHTKLAQYQS